jgi:hypothetical protein
MTYSDATFIICGNQTGLAGNYIDTSEIILISSMLEDQVYSTDEFNITRSLNDILSDTNLDLDISFLEAAQREILVMGVYTEQTPRIWDHC